MIRLRFFAIPGEPTNEALAKKLMGIAGFQTEIYACPKEIATFQPMPFLRVEGGESFYGEEAIRVFLKERSL